MSSIFISIASYCDPLLIRTVRQAVRMAANPEKLHFGVFDQSCPEDTLHESDYKPAKLSYLSVDPAQSRGCCWARNVAMSMYEGEDWFFQIDSHMDFQQDWDEKLIAAANMISWGKETDKFVISSYPLGFELVNDIPTYVKMAHNTVLAHVVKPKTGFATKTEILRFEAHPFVSLKPVRGWQIGAGCLFAPGKFAEQFPYDPQFYFYGEEQSISLRLYTHGWDVYHIPNLPIYHMYNVPREGVKARPLHWDPVHEKERAVSHTTRDLHAKARFTKLIQGEDLGVFSLGTERTMKQYIGFSGIDYNNRTISPLGYKGYWKLNKEREDEQRNRTSVGQQTANPGAV